MLDSINGNTPIIPRNRGSTESSASGVSNWTAGHVNPNDLELTCFPENLKNLIKGLRDSEFMPSLPMQQENNLWSRLSLTTNEIINSEKKLTQDSVMIHINSANRTISWSYKYDGRDQEFFRQQIEPHEIQFINAVLTVTSPQSQLFGSPTMARSTFTPPQALEHTPYGRVRSSDSISPQARPLECLPVSNTSPLAQSIDPTSFDGAGSFSFQAVLSNADETCFNLTNAMTGVLNKLRLEYLDKNGGEHGTRRLLLNSKEWFLYVGDDNQVLDVLEWPEASDKSPQRGADKKVAGVSDSAILLERTEDGMLRRAKVQQRRRAAAKAETSTSVKKTVCDRRSLTASSIYNALRHVDKSGFVRTYQVAPDVWISKKGISLREAEGLSVSSFFPALYTLESLHFNGISHRDIGPNNMVTINGEVRLIDFWGISYAMKSTEDEEIIRRPNQNPTLDHAVRTIFGKDVLEAVGDDFAMALTLLEKLESYDGNAALINPEAQIFGMIQHGLPIKTAQEYHDDQNKNEIDNYKVPKLATVKEFQENVEKFNCAIAAVDKFNKNVAKIHAFVEKYIKAECKENFLLLLSNPLEYYEQVCCTPKTPDQVCYTPKPPGQVPSVRSMLDREKIGREEARKSRQSTVTAAM